MYRNAKSFSTPQWFYEKVNNNPNVVIVIPGYVKTVGCPVDFRIRSGRYNV